MKIKTIYIKNFGKLKNFRLDLKPGMNVIYGDNESGKTTVMNFIKMMFYGSTAKSSDINKNPRKKYAPWDGSPMGGFIEFNFLNINYRLEREFGSSNISDTVTLWNTDTGTEEPISCKYDVGEQFFGLGASAFERSVFIGGMTSVITGSDKDDEISKRLMNFATSCDDAVSYEIVRKRLKTAHEELRSKSGKAGALDKLTQQLSEKTELLADAEITEQKKLTDEEFYRSLCDHLKLKKQYSDKISLHIKEQQIIRELHSLEVQNRKNIAKNELQHKIDNLYSKISNGKFIVNDQFLDECNSMLSKINFLKNIYSEKKSEFNSLSNDVLELHLDEKIQENYVELDILSDRKKEIKTKISDCEKELENFDSSLSELDNKLAQTHMKEELYKEHLADMESHNNSLMINYLLPVVSIFIVILAVFVRSPFILIALIPSTAIIFTVEKIIESSKKKKIENNSGSEKAAPDYEKIYNQFETLKSEYNEKIKKIKQDILLLNDEYADVEQKKHDLEIHNNKLISQNEQKMNEQSNLNERLNSTSNEITQLNINLMTLFSSYKKASGITEIEAYISDAQSVISEIEKTQAILNSKYDEDNLDDTPETIREKMISLKKKLSEITKESGPRLLSDQQLEVLETNLEITRKEISKLNEDIINIRSKISSQYHISECPENIRNDIAEIKKIITDMNQFDMAIEIASSALEDAGNEIRQTFGPRLNNKAKKIFSHLTNGKYSEILVSKNLDINAAENTTGKIHQWQYLSSGTAEQAYLSLRLAISDMITRNQIPLFLDDVFIQYDSERALKGFEFISEYSRLNQVLFFTCHKYEKFSDKIITFSNK